MSSQHVQLAPTPKQLDGIWEGCSIPSKPGQKHTPWNDIHMAFSESQKVNVYALQGQGYSLWKGERIPFVLSGSVDCNEKSFTIFKTHKGRYTNTLMCTGVADFSNGLLHGSYGKGSVKLSKKDKSTLVTAQSFKRVEHLSGSWAGHVSTYKTVTAWADCTIEFFLIQGAHTGLIEGKGFSLWKHDRIPFVLTGTFDLKTRRVRLKKTHCSERYKNSMEYDLTLEADKVILSGSYKNGQVALNKVNELFDLERKEMHHDVVPTLFEELSYDKNDPRLRNKRTHTKPMMRYRNDGSNPETCRRNTVNLTTPSFVLVQKTHSDNEICSGDSSGDESSDSSVSDFRGRGRRECVHHRKEPVMRKQRSVSFGSMKEGFDFAERLQNMNLTESHPNTNLTHYKAFLAGCIVDGVVSVAQLGALKAFREKHSISNEEHVQILMEVGLNAETFEDMQHKPNLRRDGSHAKQPDDTCKICFDRTIDCVLLPCGHFAICSSCAKSLDRRNDTRCPICRAKFYEAKRVYRA